MSLRAVHDAIITAIKAIDGTGTYVHNVSAADHTTKAAVWNPDTLPLVAAVLDGAPEEHAPELGNFVVTGRFIIVAFVQGAGDSADARMDAAEDMVDDLRRAFRADRGLAGTVNDMTFSATAFDGSEDDIDVELGVVHGILTVTWWEDGT